MNKLNLLTDEKIKILENDKNQLLLEKMELNEMNLKF